MNKECDDDEMPTEHCRVGVQHKSKMMVESPPEDYEMDMDEDHK